MMNRRVNAIEKIGVVGVLICGAGVGGPDSLKCLGMAVMFLLVAAAGYTVEYKLQERSEKNKAAKKAKQRTKDATFEVWLRACQLDAPFRG